MFAISPVEEYRPNTISLFIPGFTHAGAQEDSMTPLHEILQQRKLTALFQPMLNLTSGEIIGFEGLIRGPANSPLHSPINLFGAAQQHGLSLEV